MASFLRKFFGYSYNETKKIMEPYSDGLGSGTFSDIRHYIWIATLLIVTFTLFNYFKNRPKHGRVTMLIISTYLFVIRVTNQTIRAIIGAEIPPFRAFPFHMCTILSFLMPLIVIFNLKKLKPPLYTLSLMGGITTVFLGEYFNNSFLTFSAFEGILAHSILILIPIIDISIGNFKFEFRKSWSVFIALGIMLLWANIANKIFFKEYYPNYMYLQENGLPGNIGGDYYLFIYFILFVLFYFVIFGIPTLYRKVKKKH